MKLEDTLVDVVHVRSGRNVVYNHFLAASSTINDGVMLVERHDSAGAILNYFYFQKQICPTLANLNSYFPAAKDVIPTSDDALHGHIVQVPPSELGLNFSEGLRRLHVQDLLYPLAEEEVACVFAFQNHPRRQAAAGPHVPRKLLHVRGLHRVQALRPWKHSIEKHCFIGRKFFIQRWRHRRGFVVASTSTAKPAPAQILPYA